MRVWDEVNYAWIEIEVVWNDQKTDPPLMDYSGWQQKEAILLEAARKHGIVNGETVQKKDLIGKACAPRPEWRTSELNANVRRCGCGRSIATMDRRSKRCWACKLGGRNVRKGLKKSA